MIRSVRWLLAIPCLAVGIVFVYAALPFARAARTLMPGDTALPAWVDHLMDGELAEEEVD